MEPSTKDILQFFKKRVFRIFPLLWLATIASIILSRQVPDLKMLFLNLTGLFGFIQWDKYFATGAWSIGNELVFYVFFPFFMLFAKKSKPALAALGLMLSLIYVYFAFSLLNPDETLSEQWRVYVNPLNQVFLFFSGFSIGLILQNVTVSKLTNIAVLLIGLGVFVLYPAEGNTIHLVTGFSRIAFTVSCVLICASFYKLNIKFTDLVNKPLTLLGEASYSVYLLHRTVYVLVGIASSVFAKYVFPLHLSITLSLSVILTLIISYFVYEKFEKYFMRLGR